MLLKSSDDVNLETLRPFCLSLIFVLFIYKYGFGCGPFVESIPHTVFLHCVLHIFLISNTNDKSKLKNMCKDRSRRDHILSHIYIAHFGFIFQIRCLLPIPAYAEVVLNLSVSATSLFSNIWACTKAIGKLIELELLIIKSTGLSSNVMRSVLVYFGGIGWFVLITLYNSNCVWP